jgi:DNA-binding MarR family transcriptional regulator
MERDSVDQISAQWRALHPELDVRAMATIGRLGRVCALGERLIEATLSEFELTIGDFDVLAALRRSGAPHRLTPTQLYKTLMITSGAMTNRLDRLESRGLLERIDDPLDRRGVLVCLSDQGRALLDRALEAHVQNETKLLSVLTRSEQASLDATLRKLLASFEQLVLEPAPAERPTTSKRKRAQAPEPARGRRTSRRS